MTGLRGDDACRSAMSLDNVDLIRSIYELWGRWFNRPEQALSAAGLDATARGGT